jgi:hypothetical protein
MCGFSDSMAAWRFGKGSIECSMLLWTLGDLAGFLFILEVDVWGADVCARSQEHLGMGIGTCGRSSREHLPVRLLVH